METEKTIEANKNRISKNLKPLGFLALFAIALFIAAPYFIDKFSTVRCTENVLKNKPDVVMLGTWWCPYCYKARQYFKSNNISYCEYDVEKSKVGKNIFMQINAQHIPVLMIGDIIIQGFSEKSIKKALILSDESNELTH